MGVLSSGILNHRSLLPENAQDPSVHTECGPLGKWTLTSIELKIFFIIFLVRK